MNNFEESTLSDLAEQNLPFELANQREMYELRLRNQQLESLLHLKEQEIDEVYERMYIVIRFLKKKSDRKKLLSILEPMAYRKRNNYMQESRFKINSFSEHGLDRYDGRYLNNRRKNRDDRYNY